MTTVEFVVIPRWDSTVVVQWTEDFGLTGSPVHRAIVEALEPIHGVERVGIGRYSVVLEAAYHVLAAGEVNLEEVVAAVTEALFDPELLYHLRYVLSDEDVSVNVVVR